MEKTKKQPKIYQINDKWRVRSDHYCLILERCSEKGKWVDPDYYPSIESLVSALYENEIRENLDTLEKMVLIKDDLMLHLKNLVKIKKGEYE